MQEPACVLQGRPRQMVDADWLKSCAPTNHSPTTTGLPAMCATHNISLVPCVGSWDNHIGSRLASATTTLACSLPCMRLIFIAHQHKQALCRPSSLCSKVCSTTDCLTEWLVYSESTNETVVNSKTFLSNKTFFVLTPQCSSLSHCYLIPGPWKYYFFFRILCN